MESAAGILAFAGSTPVLKLTRFEPKARASIYVKLEHINPTGSVKDRAAAAMIERAESEGLLKSGGTVVEASSGNMAIALALVCALKGYRLVAVLPENATREVGALLRAYGATVHIVSTERGFGAALSRARELAAEIPGAAWLNQFENPAHLEAQERKLGLELVQAIRTEGGRADAFVAGVGTGATLAGSALALRQAFPSIRILAVEPENSAALSRGPLGVHAIQGLGLGWEPEWLRVARPDQVTTVSNEAAWNTKERLAREEGLLCGISTGANVWAALQIARHIGPGGSVYTLCADTGERYFSAAERFA